MRPTWLRRDHVYDGASVVLLLGMTGLVFAIFRDLGTNVDEPNHLAYGDALLEYYGSGFSVRPSAIDTPYGGGFNLFGALFRALMPFGDFASIHLFGGLVGVLGLLGTWKLGRLLFGARGGFWALLLLCLTPSYYAHLFDNPKDLPFAVGYVWSLYYMSAVLRDLPAVRWGTWIKLGVAIGLALSVRVGGLLLPCYLIALLAGYVVHRAVVTRSAEVGWRTTRRLLAPTAACVGTAWAVMMALWPWVAHAPIRRVLASLSEMSNFSLHDRLMPFRGEMIRSSEVPWDYLPRYFLFQLPDLVLFLALVGAGIAVWVVVERARRPEHVRTLLVVGLFGLAVVSPPLYAIYKGSTLYTGLRHFLFLIAPITVVAAGALVWCLRRAARYRWAPAAIQAVGLAVCVQQAALMLHLHPHYYAYYNRLIGGLPGAYGQYETSGSAGFIEPFHRLREHLWRTERERYLSKEYLLGGCFRTPMLQYALPPNFRRNDRGPDFWIAFTLRDCHLEHRRKPRVFDVRRQGTLLFRVREVRAQSPPGPEPPALPEAGDAPADEAAGEEGADDEGTEAQSSSAG